jgi:hypothetical protein
MLRVCVCVCVCVCVRVRACMRVCQTYIHGKLSGHENIMWILPAYTCAKMYTQIYAYTGVDTLLQNQALRESAL